MAPHPTARRSPRPLARRRRPPAASLLAGLLLACLLAALPAARGAAGTAAASSAPAGPPPARAGLAGAGTASEWTTYGGSELRVSVQPDSPALRPLRVRWRSPLLDGAVYGEPLIDDHLVFVATEADTVYALRASTGAVVWRRTLGAPVPAGELPCGDITPTVGITSTMVLDPGTDQLFASPDVAAGGAIHHELVALSPATGALLWRRDLDLPGWDAAAQLQRTGLGLADSRVIVGFGGNYGDCSDYKGEVMGVPESGRGAALVYTVPTSREGAVWAPSGVSVNAAGDVYFATGNGASSSAADFDEGDSVIELSPAFRRLGVFAPANWLQDNLDDGDLGSAAPMLLPGGRALILGKETTAYLLDAARLGGIGGQLAEVSACFSQGGDAYLAPLAYVACPNGSLTALRVGARSLSVAWRGPGGASGSPTIAGGVVWSIGNGQLHGLAPASGAQLLAVPVIQTEHFAAPSAGEGLLVVGGEDQVEAFEGPSGWRP